MGRSRVILPRKLSVDPARMARVITNTMNAVALDVKIDFEVTAQTFDAKPTFTITSPSPYTREIGTDDANYARLNEGTAPHTIFPRGKALVFRTPFQSKTLPRQIMSRGGASGGNVVFTRGPVSHPGTQAREWDTVIAQKWDREFAKVMQRAIDAEI